MERLDMLTRRNFVVSAASMLAMPRVCRAGDAGVPAWRPGELELHFIHTGRGENCFYILPDGTTVVNDCGDFYWHGKLAAKAVPFLPAGTETELGAEVVARYIDAVAPRKRLDYALVSHWHTDHTGDPSLGHRLAKDGRKVCGLAYLGERYDFSTFLDHQYPNVGQYGGGDVEGRDMIEAWLKAKRVPREPFKVGALDQIALRHDPEGKYRGLFSIRNICANAVCWTGRGEEVIDYGAIHAKAIGKASIPNQNTLSMGLLIRYGKFSFFTGGDVSGKLKNAAGEDFNYEGVVGGVVGPVDVCKTNHHAWKDAMTAEFVRAVRAKDYITCVWCTEHIHEASHVNLSSRELYPGDRRVYPTYVPAWPKAQWPDALWWKDVNMSGGNIVVKVAPRGESYRIFVA